MSKVYSEVKILQISEQRHISFPYFLHYELLVKKTKTIYFPFFGKLIKILNFKTAEFLLTLHDGYAKLLENFYHT